MGTKVHLGGRPPSQWCNSAECSMQRPLDIPIRFELAIKGADQLQKRVELSPHIRGLDLPRMAPQVKDCITVERRHSKQGFGKAQPAPPHRGGDSQRTAPPIAAV